VRITDPHENKLYTSLSIIKIIYTHDVHFVSGSGQV